MRRGLSILGTILFLLVAPGTVVGLVPWWISHWIIRPPFFGLRIFQVLGVLLILAGTPAVLDSFARFAWQGLGTPAPIFPTQQLVVSGFYRYVRNPMYVGLVWVIVGQGLLFADLRLFYYVAAVWLATHIFVITYEEPTLRRTYGVEYELFCSHVPRWIPRLTPWKV